MKPEEILRLATIGAQLVNIIGVPLAKVIQVYRSAGVSDDVLFALEAQWTTLIGVIEARIQQQQGHLGQ